MNNLSTTLDKSQLDGMRDAIVMPASSVALSLVKQQKLRHILEKGLPHTPKPYSDIAEQIDVEEAQVLAQIALWQETGLVKRFGLVVKHRSLGFTANAMVVWNIADSDVDAVADKLSSCGEVSLCYRRPRRMPEWPYNLFCMIHGKNRDVVLQQIEDMTEKFSLQAVEKDVLFSFKAYKQQGARYSRKGASHG